MREILFRGKRIDNGEWVYGGYLPKSQMICTEETKPNSTEYRDYFIIPETVGQDTGLTDKNGKKIFEGDLLLSNGNLVWLVSFENGAFVCKDECLKTYFNFYEHSDYDTKTGTFNSYISKYEVIGNIHDNPDTLKGGGEG